MHGTYHVVNINMPALEFTSFKHTFSEIDAIQKHTISSMIPYFSTQVKSDDVHRFLVTSSPQCFIHGFCSQVRMRILSFACRFMVGQCSWTALTNPLDLVSRAFSKSRSTNVILHLRTHEIQRRDYTLRFHVTFFFLIHELIWKQQLMPPALHYTRKTGHLHLVFSCHNRI